MNQQKLKGKFIVLDGPDGSGKSTQVQLLADLIKKQGVDVLTVRDPGGTKIGEQIRDILLGNENTAMSIRCEGLLYMASRAQLYLECISPALKEQKCVISDRWISSTYAYQAVGGQIGTEWVLSLSQAALERTWPDLTIIIDISAQIALGRIGQNPDRMEQKPIEFHQQVCQGFLELARSRDDFRVVDGNGSIDQIHQRICEVLSEYVDS